MIVKIVKSIKDVDRRRWNAITRGPFFSHEWFSWVEEAEGHRHKFYYFLVSEAGRLIGAIPAFTPLHPDDIYRNFLYGKIYPWVSSLPGPAGRPLICYCLGSSGKNLFSDQGFLPIVLPAVTATVHDVAVQEQFSDFVFLFVREHEGALIDALTASGFREVFLSSAAILENRFETFDDYLRSLSRNGKNSVKGDQRKYLKGGCVTTVCNDLSKHVNVIAKLVENIEKKYPSTLTKQNRKSLQMVFHKMASYRTTYLVRTGDAAIGTITLFNKDNLLSTYAGGLDYASVKENRTYFHLFYYLPIQEMIRKRAPYLNFNHMAYRVKESRGAKLVPQYMFIKSLKRNTVKRFWFEVVDRRYRSKFRKEYAQDMIRQVRETTGGSR